MYLKTNQFHVQQFAYLLDRMKKIDEGGTSLLDNSILMSVRISSMEMRTAPSRCRFYFGQGRRNAEDGSRA